MEKPAHLVLVSYFDDLFSEDGAASAGAREHGVRPPRSREDDTVVPFAALPTALPEQPAGQPALYTVPPLKRQPPLGSTPSASELPVSETPVSETPLSALAAPVAALSEPVVAEPKVFAPGVAPAVSSANVSASASQYLCFGLGDFELLLAAAAVEGVTTLPMPPREGAEWHCGQAVLSECEQRALVDVQALIGRGALAVAAGATVTAVRLREQPVLLVLPATAQAPQLQQIERSAVTWRGEHGARPWLAGTLRARRAIVLDPVGLGQMLQTLQAR